MKIKCPVALCGWEGKPHQFYKHIEDYKTKWKGVKDNGFFRSESHERWANYFFPRIWNNPDLPEDIRWTNIALAYIEETKMQKKTQQRRLSADGSNRIDMHDGEIKLNGREYTTEESSKKIHGMKVPQDSHPHQVGDITGELRIDGMMLEEYKKMHGNKIKRVK